MARVIAIANQKGGVGKTTTAVNLAASLAAAESRTLLIDGDPQGNATSGVGVERDPNRFTVYDVLIGERALGETTIRGIHFPLLDVAPATPDLAGAEIELVDHPRRDRMMRDAVNQVRDQYDYILIDCPPSLGLITLNMLAAADSLLIPVQCEYYALEGLSDLVQTIRKVRAHLNPKLEIEGLLRTMYDPRNTLALNVAAELERHFGDRLYRTVVPRNVRLAEAPSHGVPALKLEPQSKGACAYLALAGEMLRRMEARAASAPQSYAQETS